MRTSLIMFGVIFLVIGGLLYFLPMQEIKASTSTVRPGDVDNRTSTTRITVPIEWAYASAVIGMVLLILGMAIHDPVARRNQNNDSSKFYDRVVESKENIDIDEGNKKNTVKRKN